MPGAFAKYFYIQLSHLLGSSEGALDNLWCPDLGH